MHDDCDEPGYDPGPDGHEEDEDRGEYEDRGECDGCGEVRALNDEEECEECAGWSGDAAYAAAPGWKRCSWGYCEDFGADL